MANKKRIWYFLAMEIRSCRVTIADMDGVAHTVEVTAATLFEAVALGLKQLQGNEWVAGIGRPMDTVTVAVKSVPRGASRANRRVHKMARTQRNDSG
jgi:hypothetical protein